nr:hypothetical protein [Shewanella xiamenensis]
MPFSLLPQPTLYLPFKGGIMKTQLHAELAQVKRSLAITQLLGAPGILLIGLALYGLVIAEGDAFIQALNNPINCYLLIAIGSAITLWEALKIIKLSKKQTQLLKQLDECNELSEKENA